MTTSIVIAAGYDPTWLSICEHLVVREVAAGRSVVVVDIAGALATPPGSYHEGVLAAFRLPIPGHDLGERVERVNGRLVRLEDLAPDDGAEPLSPELEEVLAIAAQSALITYFRTDRPDRRRRRVRRTAEGLLRGGRRVYRGLAALLAQEEDAATGFVPNGRFPAQKLATRAFRDAGVPTSHYEKGEAAGRAYVQPYAPQDRVRSQEAVAPVLAHLTTAEVDAVADEWLARRAPAADSRNEFAALWAADLPPAIAGLRDADASVAVFFTSSQDEFQFLGPEWQLHDWDDQEQAFDAVLRRFEAQAFRCVLRVHPNLATKNDECFRRERDGIRRLAARHPELTVIWHDESVNSYALLGVADAVVVWDSTIGLEASARGIPVWTTATSRYGLVADVREVLSTDDLERDGLTAWKVDPHAAKRFIAYLVSRDEDITPGERWTAWGNQQPLGARIAAVAVSGGIPGAGAAVGSLIDVYRHRSWRSNLRALRRR